MAWMDAEEGWTKRYNTLIRLINEGEDYEGVEPPLDDREVEWFERSKKALDEENAKIAENCKKIGIEPYKVGYGMAENEW